MSSIQSNPAVLRQIVSSRSEATPASTPARRQVSADAALLYAWSIGTTRAAQARAGEKAPPLREECPPEVYIG